MKFKNLKLGTKQIVIFSIILIIMSATIFYSIHIMRSLKSELDEVTTNWLPRAIAVADINLNTTKLRLSQLQYTMTTEETSKQEQAEIMINLIDKINENPAIESIIKEIKNLNKKIDSKQKEIDRLIKENEDILKLKEHEKLQKKINDLEDEIEDRIQMLKKLKDRK